MLKDKLIIGALLLLVTSCIEEPEKKESIVTDEILGYIKEFASENGYPEIYGYGEFYTIEYKDYPYEHIETGFYIHLPKNLKPATQKLVLNDALTKIGKKVIVNENGGYFEGEINEIEIKTDSVIIIPELNLSSSYLTGIPEDIGKIRTKVLNIEDNPDLKTLPLGIMNMLNTPKPYKATNIIRGHKSNPHLHYDSLPDTLRDWFYNVYEKQDFSEE